VLVQVVVPASSALGNGPIAVTQLSAPPAAAAPVVTFVNQPASVVLPAAATYSFVVSPDPGPQAISANCSGAPATVTETATAAGYLYSFSCLFPGAGSFRAQVNVGGGSPVQANAPVQVIDSGLQFSVPAPITTAAITPSGAQVSFIATATDPSGAQQKVTCVPASGSIFPVNTGASDATTVICSATNAAGVTAQLGFPVRVFDSVPPGFGAITAPALANLNNVYYTNNPAVSAWLTVPVVTDNVAVASIELVDTVVLGNLQTTVPVAQLPGLTLAEGLHALRFQATDTSGNRAYSPVFSARVDLTPPSISVLKPAPNETFGTATVTASASVLDASPLTVTINGTSTTLGSAALNGSRVASAQLTFATSGQQQVTFTAQDLAGNVSSVVVSLIVDLAAPVLSFSVNGQTLLAGTAFGPLAGDLLLLTTRVDSAAAGALTYAFSGAPAAARPFAPLSGLTDLETVSLVEGINPISGTATTVALVDANGNPIAPKTANLVTSVIYDKTPPSGAIAVPTAGSAVRGVVQLSGTATDACPANTLCPVGGLTGVSAASFTIDSLAPIAAQLSGGVWSAAYDTSALAFGPHQVTMTMLDGVGNQATTAVTPFTLGGPPSVSFTSLADGSSIPASSFDVTAVAVSDFTQITKLTLATGAQSYPCTPAIAGATLGCTWANFNFAALCPFRATTCPVSFTATALDAVGQSATTTVTLTIDPSLKTPLRYIAAPKAGATVRGTFQLITLQAGAGFANVTCAANGTPVGSSATGKLVASVNTLPYLDGPLALSCTWTDAAGRTDTKSETVQVQNWLLEVSPSTLDLRSCSKSAPPVQLELEGYGHVDPAGGPTVGLLQPAAQGGKLSLHLVSGTTDHSSTPVPVTYASLATSTDDRQKPLELKLKADRCALITAAKEALSGHRWSDDDDRPLTLQLRQGSAVLDSATLRVKGN
jgi:hypothetical protein